MEKILLVISSNKEKVHELQKKYFQYDVLLHAVKSTEIAIKELLKPKNYLLIIFIDNYIIGDLRRVRKITKTPILVVRNHYNSEEKIDAIEAGADEYIEWPKTIEESIASCHALIRRFTELNYSEQNPIDEISCGNITISLYYHTVFINGHKLDFPRREFDLLYLLVSSPRRVFTFEQLSQKIWGDDYEPTENSLHSCIRRVRRKMESVPGNICHIKNIRGVGYCFIENEIFDST